MPKTVGRIRWISFYVFRKLAHAVSGCSRSER